VKQQGSYYLLGRFVMTESVSLKKVRTLAEALPYIQRFRGKTIVLKYGGAAMLNDELKKAVIEDVLLLQLVGIKIVVIHGGGPEINDMLRKLNISPQFVQGLRVTDNETMEVVEMVLAGKVNKDIVGLMNQAGGQAVGLSGKDAGLLQAEKEYARRIDKNGRQIKDDIGSVGRVVEVRADILHYLLNGGYIPVISPIAVGAGGESYNVNADLAAAKVAAALKAEKLLLLTDVPGLLRDCKDEGSLISRLHINEIPDLIRDEIISGGMIPKVRCCTDAINEGVKAAHILDGRVPHCMLLEIFTKEGVGTMFTS